MFPFLDVKLKFNYLEEKIYIDNHFLSSHLPSSLPSFFFFSFQILRQGLFPKLSTYLKLPLNVSLSLSPTCWDFRLVPPCPAYVVLMTKLRALCDKGKHTIRSLGIIIFYHYPGLRFLSTQKPGCPLLQAVGREEKEQGRRGRRVWLSRSYITC